MPGNDHEVLKYDIDYSLVEAKAKRLHELMEEISKGRAAEQDTSELEQQFNAEFAALEKLVPKEKEAAGAIDGLVKQKENLVAVTRLLRGKLGGLGGDLGGVIELLMKGSTHALGFAGALAGITAAIALYKQLKDAIQEAIDKQEELNEGVAKQKGDAIRRGAGLAETLRAMGAIERFPEAATMTDRVRKEYGFDPGDAQRAAAPATVAGRTVEEAGIIAMAQDRGVSLPNAEAVQDFFRTMTPAAAAAWRAQLDESAKTSAAAKQRMVARMDLPTGSRQTPEELLYETLGERGELPEGVESLADLQWLINNSRERLAAPKFDWLGEDARARRERGLGKAARLIGMLGEGAAPVDVSAGPAAGGGSAAVTQHITYYDQRINAGTIHNAPSRRTVFGPSGISVNIGGQNYLRSGNGF